MLYIHICIYLGNKLRKSLHLFSMEAFSFSQATFDQRLNLWLQSRWYGRPTVLFLLREVLRNGYKTIPFISQWPKLSYMAVPNCKSIVFILVECKTSWKFMKSTENDIGWQTNNISLREKRIRIAADLSWHHCRYIFSAGGRKGLWLLHAVIQLYSWMLSLP
jgi:hypothetical protein